MQVELITRVLLFMALHVAIRLKGILLVTFLVRHIIVGILLFLSHHYLDPVYQQLNATTAINVVDLSVSSLTISLMSYTVIGIIIHCVKNRKCQCCTVITVTALFAILIVSLIIASSIKLYSFTSGLFLTYNGISTLIIPICMIFVCNNYCARACGPRALIIAVTMLLLYNVATFLGLLISLGFLPQPSESDATQNWENTINQSYGSAISLIFTALHVALINFFGFISSLFVIIKYLASNEHTSAGYQHLDSTSLRRSDYGAMHMVISYIIIRMYTAV